MKPAIDDNRPAGSRSEGASAAGRAGIPEIAAAPVAGNPLLATLLGAGWAIGFYALLLGAMRLGPTQPYTGQLSRYFLGHPVAVAATILFSFALAMLVAKTLGVMTQKNLLMRIADADLLPSASFVDSPAGQWLHDNDAGHVARGWIADLDRLPASIRGCHLVTRLEEVLTRQSQRGSTKNLADDLRELSGRDADAAHDSLGLVRIIVWAIPMLGFLGTVIGITQTLGGLDFSSGTAAVDNLKSGLYVAFDTTAMGLVLSVVAIFLQFPVERSEQRLLAAIDARIGHLVSSTLPSDEASDNQTVLIAELCRGVQAAVAESLSNQAKLWRDTIDSAQSQWQDVHEKNNNTIADAFELTLAPALLNHANTIIDSSKHAGDRFVAGIEHALRPALTDHASALEASSTAAAIRLQQQCAQWQDTISATCDAMATQQWTLNKHYETIQTTHASLQQLHEAQAEIQRGMAVTHGDGMAEAMRILARAVDVLSDRMNTASTTAPTTASRRAA